MNKNKVSNYYDSIADHYEEDYSDDPYWVLYNEITWHNIKKHIPKSKSSLIVDVGGGTGFFGRKIAKLGYNVVVTDISEKMLKRGKLKAKKAGLSKQMLFTWSDIVDMKDQKTGRFDLVLCEGDPVSYSKNPEKSIKELIRITKPGGKIIASVDNLFTQFRRALRMNPKEITKMLKTQVSDIGNVMPQYNFRPEELRSLFQANGCEIISLTGKPVFVHTSDFRVPNMEKNLKTLIKLEKKFGSDPSLVGQGGHLEIVAKKI